MTENETMVPTRDELLREIDATWEDLQVFLDSLSPAQLTGPTDAAGWTAKDHLAHLTAWEKSMDVLFHGQPRHEALGVDKPLYESGDYDAINAVIKRQHANESIGEVLNNLNQTHAAFLATLHGLSDDDLKHPQATFLPGDPEADDAYPVGSLVYGNTVEHYPEHQDYIAKIVGIVQP